MWVRVPTDGQGGNCPWWTWYLSRMKTLEWSLPIAPSMLFHFRHWKELLKQRYHPVTMCFPYLFNERFFYLPVRVITIINSPLYNGLYSIKEMTFPQNKNWCLLIAIYVLIMPFPACLWCILLMYCISHLCCMSFSANNTSTKCVLIPKVVCFTSFYCGLICVFFLSLCFNHIASTNKRFSPTFP